MISLLLHEVRVRRGTILGWTIGLGFFSLIYMFVYPALPAEVRDIDVQALALLQSLGVRSLATFDRFMLSTEYNFLPLLAAVFGLFLGVGALAGEEADGTLELLAALPISRLQLILAKAAALTIIILSVLLAVGLVVMAGFTALHSKIDTPITALDLFRVTFSHVLIAWVFMALSLFLGAYLPNRGSAMAAAAAALVVSFFGDNLAGMVPALASYKPFFPHSYFARIVEMLTGNVPWGDVWVLLFMAVAFLVLAALSFQRRNLTVGAWPWQRPKLARHRP